ncbi:MAG: galactose-1-phosphate uridylyltransferase [bacterium]
MSEFRKDPVIGRWVIISSERGKRPDDFITVPVETKNTGCPFCPGFEHKTPPEILAFRDSNSQPDTPGWHVRVVRNKFPALAPEGELEVQKYGVFESTSGIGAHEVFIETPDHNQAFEDLEQKHILHILESYNSRFNSLACDSRLRYVLIFKNVGERAGASLSHSHSQLIATPQIPKRIREELRGAADYYNKHNDCIFCKIIQTEIQADERLVFENSHYMAFCPYASRFPFEMWFMPKKHQPYFHHENPESMKSLASALKSTLQILNTGLKSPQYNFMMHTGPLRFGKTQYGKTVERDFHWHIEIIPRLVHTAGFEWGSGFYINPTPPEDAAEFLRKVKINCL